MHAFQAGAAALPGPMRCIPCPASACASFRVSSPVMPPTRCQRAVRTSTFQQTLATVSQHARKLPHGRPAAPPVVSTPTPAHLVVRRSLLRYHLKLRPQLVGPGRHLLCVKLSVLIRRGPCPCRCRPVHCNHAGSPLRHAAVLRRRAAAAPFLDLHPVSVDTHPSPVALLAVVLAEKMGKGRFRG